MNSLPSILRSAVTDVVQSLGNFSADPLFAEKFSLVFGADALSAGRFTALVANLPEVEVLADEVLQGALGAFSAQTGKIYLSESLVNENAALLQAVLLEEIGHYLDAQVNVQDTLGDEGELFSAVVLGLPLGAGELERIQVESDQGFLTTEEGQVVEIEMATLIKGDLFPTDNSNPSNLTNVNGVLYFTANDGVNGYELWKSDGTTAGTVLVKDVRAGIYPSDISNLVNVNGVLYFTADDGVSGNGNELWKSDGTTAGTVLVKDISPNSIMSSFASSLTGVNGVLYFAANDGVNGYELWKSDGTTAGTALVKDIDAGLGSSSPSNLVNVNGVLYFRADDGVNGNELWKSDGTTAGTVLVKDIRVGSSSSQILNLVNVNGVLYFRANDGVNGYELWKSDGTTAGTALVKDIRAGSGGSNPSNLTNVNGVLYFRADDGVNGNELWKSDGTTVGTTLIKDIMAGSVGSNNSFNPFASNLTDVNGTLYFVANDGVNGHELWKSNGTTTGTTLVKDIWTGGIGSYPSNLTNVNGVLYFRANDEVNGHELWKSDGTTAGTALVKNISAGASSSFASNLTNVNGVLYFIANDGVNGEELWKSDGTTAGTVLVKDINQRAITTVVYSNVNGVLYFTADDGVNGDELWKSDGTTAGTVLVKDIRVGGGNSFASDLTNVNGALYFTADDGVNGNELWKSNGTTAGTVLVKNISAGSGGSNPSNLTNVNGVLYFTADDGVNGDELWKSDGTTAGTVLVKDIRAGFYPSSNILNLTDVNGVLYFTADDGVNGEELWKSNGTTAGTVLVKNIRAGNSSSYTSNLTNVNGVLYFTASDGVNGNELWKSNGTMAGTVLVKDIWAGGIGSNPSNLTNVNGALYFTAYDGVNGNELWKSDGTTAGTVLVKNISAGNSSSYTSNLINVNGALYFTANDGVNGNELWKSDGTTAGTVLVKNINAGFGSSNPSNLTNVNGVLYFTADDGVNGVKIWTTDGTAANTQIADMAVAPTGLVSFLDTLFFQAADPDGIGVGLQSLGGNIPIITLTVSPVSVTEDGATNLVYTFTRTGLTTNPQTVNYSITGTADATDYTGATPGTGKTITFNPGSTTATLTIDPAADASIEGNETVILTLASGTGYTIGATGAVTGTILNDDTAVATNLAISATSADQTEGNSGSKAFTFTVNRSGSITGSNSVNWAVTGVGTNPANATDFAGGVLPNGTVSFGAGETSKIITVNVQGDSTVELNETFQVTLSNPTNGATIATASAQGTIQNDDTPQITLNVSPSSVLENGVTNLTYTFTRTGPTTTPLTVNYSISGTADATDYTGATPGTGKTITFAVGSAIATVTVDPTADTTVESDETVAFTLATGAGYIIGTTNAVTGAIANDDAGLAISPGNADQTEGDSGSKAFTFIVNRSGYLLTAVSVDYTVGGALLIELVDGRQSATADDFTWGFFPSGTISFVAGETSKVITVNVQGDTTPEVDGDFPSEDVFIVTLSNPTNGATITHAHAFGTIQNDDTSISLSVATSANQTEGNSGSKAFTFTVNRVGITTGIHNVNWAVTGTGTNPANAADFVGGVLPSGVVSFGAGETSKLITVNVQGDTAIEPNETFQVTLSHPTNGATIATASATGTIQNDDTSSGSTFTGTTGNDTLNGTTGADTLIGLAGNDIYTVNHAGDVVTENLNEGIDNIKSSINYTLPNNVEKLFFTGSANLNGTGNALNNTLTGNKGANTLTGLAGNDTLDGKTGADTMIGGLGDDTYTVDNIGDVVIENPNEGTDTVKSSISYTLGANLENLTLTGSANLNGTGNALNNKLTGNTGANILNGGVGSDTLAGKAGNDIFVFRFGESTVTALDRITDFAIGADKIDLLTQGGAAMNAPVAFARAADSAATTNINTIVNNVFADANGAQAGNQALGINQAALVRAGTSTYLIINDGTASFQSANDLVINLTGITGTLPALGTIPVGNFFA